MTCATRRRKRRPISPMSMWPLDPPLVGRLVERTEGWIAGLQLAAISLRDRPDPAALIEAFGGSQRFVLDYLADEVLGRVDDELRAFLVQTLDRRAVHRRAVPRADRSRGCRGAPRSRGARRTSSSSRSTRSGAGIATTASSPTTCARQLSEDERRELHERAADYFERHGLGVRGDRPRAGRRLDRPGGPPRRARRRAGLRGRRARDAPAAGSRPCHPIASRRARSSSRCMAWALFETGQAGGRGGDGAERISPRPRRAGPAEGRLLVLLALMATVTGPDAEDLAHEGLGLVGDDTLLPLPRPPGRRLRQPGPRRLPAGGRDPARRRSSWRSGLATRWPSCRRSTRSAMPWS